MNISSQISTERQKWLDSESNIYKDALTLEIDNHSDTHCFGKNFRPIFWSDFMCTVSPFLSEYSATENIEICTAATAWTSPEGRTYILVLDRVFGLEIVGTDPSSTQINVVHLASKFVTTLRTPTEHSDFTPTTLQ